METNLKNLPKHFNPDSVLKGDQGEQIVAHILRKSNYFVICLSDINEQGRGGAPGMRNNQTFHTLPDLQVALQGKLGFCEVKWKTKADWTRITQQEEHGIDKVCWDHYCQVSKQTGTDVFLFIYERKSGAVLYNHINFLRKVIRYTSKMGRGGMCFFPRSSFYLWGRVIQVGKNYYHQLDAFQMLGLEGDGDKLWGIIQHKDKL
jgi:hypothetical protein